MTKQTKESTMEKRTSLEASVIGEFISKYATTVLFVVAAFVIGMLFTEVRYLKKGVGAGAPTGGTVPAANDQAGALGQPSAETAKNVPPVENSDHFRGGKDAKVTLVVYTDYECPFCKQFHDTITQVLNDYKDKVKVVYRHYPLSFHANAHKAAEAAECVAKNAGEEAFWKFTDLYFKTTDSSGTGVAVEDMPGLAAQSGANEAAVKKCLDSDELATLVDDSMAGGTLAGVSGTPGTIVIAPDNKFDFISGALPLPSIKATLDQYVK
jgi:protein-disulfide isomerase